MRAYVVETHQKNVPASTVVRDLKQIDDAEETRLSRQLRCYVGKADGLDGVHLNVTFLHGIPATHFDVPTRPDSDATRNLSTTNSLAETLGKHHEEESTPGANACSGPAYSALKPGAYVIALNGKAVFESQEQSAGTAIDPDLDARFSRIAAMLASERR